MAWNDETSPNELKAALGEGEFGEADRLVHDLLASLDPVMGEVDR